MRLANARCIWSIQSSMGLDRRQAKAIANMKPRRAVVHYTLHPTPFEIEVPELNFPTKPEEQELQRQAEDLLSKARWSYHDDKTKKTTAAATRMLAPDDLAGDVLVVMVRICEAPAESIEQRCTTLRIDRAREFRARAELDARGLISMLEQTIGGKIRFFQPTDKGVAWAQKRNLRIKKFKSGVVHEYLLCQVEKRIGLVGTKWRLQRNSSVARDQGLQPDLLAMGPDGERIIVEVCCSNLDYDARNILIEAEIPEIDKVIAVTPDKRTKKSLEQALEKNCENSSADQQESIILLDAGQCLADIFDWAGTLVDDNKRLFPGS